ncbi:MAG: GNAT family N-acetyltransferase [Phycisphaeraceae bacterium]|nr:GNAT family N-acetyltransferase [Phycisphaeraceae bacterium]
MSGFEIDKASCRTVAPEIIRPIRQSVLRPNQTIDEMVYEGDTAPGTFHLAAIDPAGQVLGIASFYRDPHPLDPGPGDWRLRGMAVEPALQGKGLGALLVQAGIERIREQDGRRLWCNARVSAQRFYEKLGFTIEGEVFEIEPIGLHYVMSAALQSS